MNCKGIAHRIIALNECRKQWSMFKMFKTNLIDQAKSKLTYKPNYQAISIFSNQKIVVS